MKRQCSILKVVLGFISVLSILFSFGANSKEKVELNVQIGEEIRFLDPQKATGIGSSHIGINLFEGLFHPHPKTNDPEKALVKSYTKDKTSTVWTFKLKKNHYWAKVEKDGSITKKREIQASDVVYSYRRILSPQLASEYSYMLYVIKNAEKFNKGEIKDPNKIGVKALDNYTVQITLRGPVPTFIQYLMHHSYTLVPREPIEKYGESWIKKGNMWCGSAFLFKEWKLKDRIIAVKNPYYPGAEKIQFDQINFIFIGTYSPEAVRAFRAKKTDIDFQPPPSDDIRSLRKKKLISIARQLGTYFIRLNTNKEGLKDVRVRKALSLAINRDDIVRYVMKSGQKVTTSLVPAVFKNYKSQEIKAASTYKERVKEAKRLMKEAGYPNGKGFPAIQYLYNTSEKHQTVAVMLTKMWKKHLGITITPYNQEWKVYLQTIKHMEHDMARAGWVADYNDPMNFLDMFLASSGNNNTGFNNKTYDALINSAMIDGNMVNRYKTLEKAERLLMDNIPLIPLFTYTSSVLKQRYIKKVWATKLSQHPLKDVQINMKLRKKILKL